MQAIGPLPRKMQARAYTSLYTVAGTKWTLLRICGPPPMQVNNATSSGDLMR